MSKILTINALKDIPIDSITIGKVRKDKTLAVSKCISTSL